MCKQKIALALFAVMIIAGCATTNTGAKWECSAPSMINSFYTGGSYAMIHLSEFATGGSYKVKLNEQGNTATGTTANGTAFRCVKLP